MPQRISWKCRKWQEFRDLSIGGKEGRNLRDAVNLPKWFYQETFMENLRFGPAEPGMVRYRFSHEDANSGDWLRWLLIFGAICGLVYYLWSAKHWNVGYSFAAILCGVPIILVVVAMVAYERFRYELSVDVHRRTVAVRGRGLLSKWYRSFTLLPTSVPTTKLVAYWTDVGKMRVWGVFLSCTEGEVLLWVAEDDHAAAQEAERLSALLRAP